GFVSDQLLHRARVGAALLGSAVTLNSVSQIRRAMRGVAFAMALKNARGTPTAALQSYNPEVRLFCLAAIAAVQKHPLLKAALLTTGIDDFARVALLRTYHREARLLATVDRIAPDTAPRSHVGIKEQRTNLIGISPSRAKNVAF
ncbi:hypothetical protein P7L87_26105, partial [Vibrio parahaemolyticus]|nr:hypothetical protein [Vibrio parahaemolyticus]